VNAYDAEIAWWDHCFGELVAELGSRGLLDRTLVVVTADHGEGFLEHGTWRHGNSLHEEVLRVPLVVRLPGGGPAKRAGWPVSLTDLPATILSAAGFGPPASMSESRDVLVRTEADRSLYARLAKGDLRRTLARIRSDTKWIHAWLEDRETMQCFDVGVDPSETFDLSQLREGKGREVKAALARRAAWEEKDSLAPGRAEIDEGLDAALRALGYIK
jgi:arylsulfatase